jgi:tripartite-type tricarboxylate transporter receptor subunit TctC
MAASAIRTSRAQDSWPSRPIRLLVPFSPGGVTDTSGRLIAEALAARLGQSVVVENKPGASGNIGMVLAKTAPADGYTLVMAFDGTVVINPHVFAKLPFDSIKDFAAVGKVGDAALVLAAHAELPVKTLNDVVALSKTRSDGLAYGTSGTGSTPHIACELLKIRTGANLVHVPYKGGGQAVADAAGGNIALAYVAVAGALGFIKAGKLRAIAVSGPQRLPDLPDVETFEQAGISDFVVNSWVGVLAPAATPEAIVARLNAALNAVLGDNETRQRLRNAGIEATPGSGDAFRRQIEHDLARYGPIVKAAGIEPQ